MGVISADTGGSRKFWTHPGHQRRYVRVHDVASPSPDPPQELVPVVSYASENEAYERAVVVLAMNSECEVAPEPPEGYTVRAEQARAAMVAREIAAYDQEQAEPQMPAPIIPVFSAGIGHAVLWAMVLAGGFLWQQYFPSEVDRFTNSTVGLWARAEWWRPFTALFLHADLAHLMGNVALGVLLGLWAAHAIGANLAWVLILLSGTLGNAINSVIRAGEDFTALGASTAVFGTLGLLTGIGALHAFRAPSRAGPLRPLIPLIAGMILLAWFGGGGDPRTDVSAHLCGFGVGACFGPIAAAWSLRHAVVPEIGGVNGTAGI